MYAIAGVSGNTGSVVADTLLAQGKAIRVIVRDAAKGAAWAARGAEVAIADVSDRDAMARALTGVTGAYLLLPPALASTTPIEHAAAVAQALGAAVRAAKVPHVVMLSSLGAEHAAGVGPIRFANAGERELAASGTALTTVRAGYFQENWGGSLGMLAQGVLPSFMPVDVKFPQIATRDIGRTAAAALVEGPQGRQIIELLGPREYSANDAAEILATLTGKPVVATQFPLDGVVPTLTQFGISKELAGMFREMYEGMAKGLVRPLGQGTRVVRGTVELADTLKALVSR